MQRRVGSVLLAVALLSTGCGDGTASIDGVERSVPPTTIGDPIEPYVVGDSSAVQIVKAAGYDGSVQSGCGFTGHSGWPIPCAIPLEPPTTPNVIAGVSIWDIGASDLSAYRAAHDYYRSHDATVTWVAAPEMATAFGPADDVAAFNDRVAEALGCDLVSNDVRRAEFSADDIHYTDRGALSVAERYRALDPAADCA